MQGLELREVFKILAETAGFEVVWLVPGQETVTLEWDGIPLEDALRELLRNKSYLIVYRAGSTGRVPSRVWVLEDRERDPEGLEMEKAGDPEEYVRSAAAELGQLIWELEQEGEEALLTDLLLERVHDSDTEIQRLALGSLVDSVDPRIGAILADVVQYGSDLGSRQLAAFGLARRGGAEGIGALLQALQDPDPQVRQMLLQVLATLGEAASPALAWAIDDPDPEVSEAARDLLGKQ